MSGRWFTMTEDGDILAHYTSLDVARQGRAIWNWTRGDGPRCEVFEDDGTGAFRPVDDADAT